MSPYNNAAMNGSDAATADVSRSPAVPGDVPAAAALPPATATAADSIAGAALPQTRREPRLPGDDETPLTRWIVAYRVHIFVVAAVFYALAFNGQWRVGRDSALYRGLAHSLASGQGYQFTDFSARQIYPGLPVLLAGLEKVFGQRDWPPIILIHLFSLGCLVVTYRLIRLRFPQWVAIAVTACTALNAWFLELTNEIRDDVPFLFGMLLALYGWERLRIALAASLATRDDADATVNAPPDMLASQATRLNGKLQNVTASIAILLIGLAVAALMRPTFWILAIAWVLTCVLGMIVGPRRKFYAISFAILLAVWLAVMAVDPRVHGFSPLGGGYERDARAALAKVGEKVVENVPQMLGDGLAYGFFGQKWAPGLTQLINVAVILSSLLLLRKYPLWALLILGTIGVTIVMTPVPRYYVMILPLLALSWLLLVVTIARRVPAKHFELAIMIGLIMMVAPNLARSFKVISEQRKGQRSVDGPKWRDVAEMSRRIREIVPPGEKVIGPEWAPIANYLSGRHIVGSRDIIPTNKRPQIWPHHLEALKIRYAIFPAKLYDDAERKTRFLIDRGVIVPTVRVARVGEEWVLAEITIDVPPAGKDWRKQPIREATFTHKTAPDGTTRPSNEVIAARRARRAAERREAAERQAAAIARAKREAKQAKLEQQAKEDRHAAAVRRRRLAARRSKAAKTPPTVTQPAATQPASSLQRPTSVIPREPWRPRDLGVERVSALRDPSVVKLPRDDMPSQVDVAFDVGGSAGQSFASRKDSICFSENFRDPRLIPWQRWPAVSQFSLLASSPSQNGQVRHWSGRTS